MNQKVANVIGFFLGFISSLALLFIYLFPNVYVFVVTLVLWWSILLLFDRLFKVPKRSIALQLNTSLCLMLILSLVEWALLPWALILLAGFLFVFIWRWSSYFQYERVDFRLKPLRRFVLMTWAFDVYTIFTYVFALNIFFPQLSFWLLSFVAGLWVAVITMLVWNLYDSNFKKNILWGLVIMLSSIELLWALRVLPFGYFVLGLFIAWIWYVVQLLIRFNISPQGIIWRKQRWFLLANIVLFILTFYIIKWI